ncbi:MAG: hypothetical protein AAFX87_15515 [Bacteroidota bacterium]
MKKSIFGMALVISLFYLSSCGEDELTTTPLNQEIELTGLQAGETVRGTLSLGVQLEDIEFEKIEISIDDSLANTITALPLAYELNSELLEDGEHKIQAKAYSTTGETFNLDLIFNVSNFFFSFEISNAEVKNTLGTTAVIVSDADGNVLASSEIHDGGAFTVTRFPNGFEGQFYNVSIISYYVGDANNPVIFTYQDVPVQTSWDLSFNDRFFGDFEQSQNTTVEFVNGNQNASYFFSSLDLDLDRRTGSFLSASSSGSLSLRLKPKSDLYIREYLDGNNRFLLKKDFDSQLGEAIDLNDLVGTLGNHSIQYNSALTSIAVTLRGFQTEGQFADGLLLDADSEFDNLSGNVDLLVPENTFAGLGILVRAEQNSDTQIIDHVFGSNSSGSLPTNLSFNKPDLSFGETNNEVTIQTTENYDWYITLHEAENNSGSITWVVFGGEENTSYVLPELSIPVKEVFPALNQEELVSSLELSGTRLYSTSSVEGYEDYLQRVIDSWEYEPIITDDYCLACETEEYHFVFVGSND